MYVWHFLPIFESFGMVSATVLSLFLPSHLRKTAESHDKSSALMSNRRKLPQRVLEQHVPNVREQPRGDAMRVACIRDLGLVYSRSEASAVLV